MNNPRKIQWLSLGALIGPILFTLAWFLLGLVSPGFTIYGVTISPYSPISAQISGLGLGPTAFYMNAAFVLTGVLLLVGLVGIFSGIEELRAFTCWICVALLAIMPLGAIMVGIFTIDSGFIHYLASITAFFSPVIAFLVTGLQLRKIPCWRRFAGWLIFAGPLTLILLVIFFMTFVPTPEGQEAGIGGLVERVLVTEVLFWYAAMGWISIVHAKAVATQKMPRAMTGQTGRTQRSIAK